MSKLAKIGFSVALVVAGMLVGAYMGYYARESQTVAEEVLILGKYSFAIEMAKREGAPGAYENALLEFISFAENREPMLTMDSSADLVALDAAFAYFALGKLEAQKGNLAESKAYFEKLEQNCPGMLRDCSLERMSRMAAAFEN